MNDSTPLVVRPATVDDLDPIVDLTRARRHTLAAWEPYFWNPRAGIDDLHPFFLKWCIEGNPACNVLVATEAAQIVGCVFAHDQVGHFFLDDFCVADERWTDVGTELAKAAQPEFPALLCAPTKDLAEQKWLASSEFTLSSTYHSNTPIPPLTGTLQSETAILPPGLPAAPLHTFGRFDTHTELGLRVATADGYCVGSPPVNPPAYDPGGPTTVIDRVIGVDRPAILASALQIAKDRGDAQVIVVVDAQDHELAGIVAGFGATQPVQVWSRPDA